MFFYLFGYYKHLKFLQPSIYYSFGAFVCYNINIIKNHNNHGYDYQRWGNDLISSVLRYVCDQNGELGNQIKILQVFELWL